MPTQRSRLAQSGQLIVVFIPLTLAGGCSKGDQHPVAGTVSFNTVPVEKGDIVFRDSTGKTLPVHARIVNGLFQLRCPAGSKRVEIRATRPSGNLPGIGPVFEDYLPEQFNTASTLTADVGPGRENHFEFKLQASP
jgi:hypothetical protein